jgi:hypothetical protein
MVDGDEPGHVYWQYGYPLEPTGPRIDITNRVAARAVDGCDRICLDSPAGPCAEYCYMKWVAEP